LPGKTEENLQTFLQKIDVNIDDIRSRYPCKSSLLGEDVLLAGIIRYSLRHLALSLSGVSVFDL
jgi:hypothetical protein